MALEKRFNIKGLNLRQTDLVRDPSYASDVQNLLLDSRGQLVKRNGYSDASQDNIGTIDLVPYGTNDYVRVVDNKLVDSSNSDINVGFDTTLMPFNASISGVTTASFSGNYTGDGEIEINVIIDSTGIPDTFRWLKNGVEQASGVAITGGAQLLSDGISITFSATTGAALSDQWNIFKDNLSPYSEAVDHAEYNSVLYVSDPALDNNIIKYDGNSYYRAGLPKPKISEPSSPAASDRYYRFMFVTIDNQDNIIYSDFYQTEEKLSNSGLDTVSIQNLGGTSFNNKYLFVNGVDQTLTRDNLTISVAEHNLVAGDSITYIQTSASGGNAFVYNPIRLEVDSVTAGTVTFVDDFYDDLVVLPGGVLKESPVFKANSPYSTVAVLAFQSENETFGYRLIAAESGVGATGYHHGLRHGSFSYSTGIIVGSPTPSFTPFMEEIVDTTIVRGEPPKAKYISIFNGLMTAASTADNPNFVFWSDESTGSSIETFAPFSNVDVGNSAEGAITGIYQAADFVAIFKKIAIYYINGDLNLGSFRVQNVFTNTIGCDSHKTIQEVGGDVVFLSERGFYTLRPGSVPTEIGDVIEPLFTDDLLGLDLDTTSGRAISLQRREKYYCYIKSNLGSASDRVVIYDYYYNSWFILSGIEADGGFLNNNNVILHSDGTSLYQEVDGQKFDLINTAIDAFYKTAWENMGEPSLEKKFTDFKVFSLGSENYTLTLQTEEDWDETTVTNETIVFDSDSRFGKQKPNSNSVFSMRFIMQNNVSGEGFLVTGYEIEYEPSQVRMKR